MGGMMFLPTHSSLMYFAGVLGVLRCDGAGRYVLREVDIIFPPQLL
jgi:hypothetical protein